MMTRDELYRLVWETPMIRLAKTFNLSDVGLRKICQKHGIPTPPLGYWAKVSNGKRVKQPALPPPPKGVPDKVFLSPHVPSASDLASRAERDAVLEKQAQLPPVGVPDELPEKPHAVTRATGKAVRAATVDYEGFKNGLAPGAVATRIGPDCIDRALRVIEAFIVAAESRGYTTVEHDQGIRLVVDGIAFSWRVQEAKDKRPHVPTQRELAAQAGREEDRRRWPTLYRSDTKAYAA